MRIVNHTAQPQAFPFSRTERVIVPRASNGSPGSVEVEAHVIDALRASQKPAGIGFRHLCDAGQIVVTGEAPKVAKASK